MAQCLPHVQRMIDERNQLDEKLKKLNAFNASTDFLLEPSPEQRDKRDQAFIS